MSPLYFLVRYGTKSFIPLPVVMLRITCPCTSPRNRSGMRLISITASCVLALMTSFKRSLINVVSISKSLLTSLRDKPKVTEEFLSVRAIMRSTMLLAVSSNRLDHLRISQFIIILAWLLVEASIAEVKLVSSNTLVSSRNASRYIKPINLVIGLAKSADIPAFGLNALPIAPSLEIGLRIGMFTSYLVLFFLILF